MHVFVSVLHLLTAAAPLWAADADSRAGAIAPFVNERTIAVGYVDLSRIDVAAAFDWIADVGKIPSKQMAGPREEVTKTLQKLTAAGAHDVFVVASIDDFPQQLPLIVFTLADASKGPGLVQLIKEMHGLDAVEQRGQAVVGGNPAALKRLAGFKPAGLPDLAKGFAAAGNSPVQGVFLLASDLRRAVDETLPTLPPELGSSSTKVLTQGVRWASVAIDLPPTAAVRLTVQSTDANAAKSLRDFVIRIPDQKMISEFLPDLARMKQLLTPTVVGDQLKLQIEPKALVELARPVTAKMKQASQTAILANQLKQIGLAMHNSYDTYKSLPAWAIYDKEKKKPLLSWRVHILPYIEQDNLYRQFHLDEPWDSEHNKKLIPMMPKVYAGQDAKLAGEGKTTILAPLGDATMFPIGPAGIKFQDVSDGTSNTIFIVVARDENAVIWTRPEDLKIDPENPAKGLANDEGKGYWVLMVDGSVRHISSKIASKMLWALFTKGGGEVVEIP